MIIDTHAHYDDEAFDIDRDELINNFNNENVGLVVNVGASLRGCEDTLKLTKKYPNVYGALGVHPSDVEELDEEKLSWLKDSLISNALYNGGKIVALGEIGLDYYYEDPPKDIQIEMFKKQLDIAKEVKLPVIIHSRDAAKDTLDILKEYYNEGISGIIHCYSYSAEIATEYLKMGYYFGIGGVLTFKNARKLIEAVEIIPIEAIVLETDSPYLTPVPYRGERNDSSKLKYVVEKLAEIKGISEEEVIKITEENARRVYRLDANA